MSDVDDDVDVPGDAAHREAPPGQGPLLPALKVEGHPSSPAAGLPPHATPDIHGYPTC